MVKKIIKNIKGFNPNLSQEALKKKISVFNRDVRKNASTAISAAFALLIALAWKDVIADFVNKIVEALSLESGLYIVRFVIALIITAICVLGIWISSKIAAKEEQ